MVYPALFIYFYLFLYIAHVISSVLQAYRKCEYYALDVFKCSVTVLFHTQCALKQQPQKQRSKRHHIMLSGVAILNKWPARA